MTEKELLYIDDILGHITNMEEYLDMYAASLEDEKFSNVVEELGKLNRESYKKFYKTLSK